MVGLGLAQAHADGGEVVEMTLSGGATGKEATSFSVPRNADHELAGACGTADRRPAVGRVSDELILIPLTYTAVRHPTGRHRPEGEQSPHIAMTTSRNVTGICTLIYNCSTNL
jgi:hypothetical protein